MELEHKVMHSKHITYEDMERLTSLNSEELSDTDLDWVRKMDEMIDSCSICRRRYMLFVNTQASFACFASKKRSLRTKAIQYVKECLSQVDQTMREKLSAWLDGSLDFMNELSQITLRPAAAAGMRDLEDSEDTVDLDISMVDENGFFEFELKKESKLSFSIKKEVAGENPLCLAIFGREETKFAALYPLTPFGTSYLRAKMPAALAAGKYVMCVPTLRTGD